MTNASPALDGGPLDGGAARDRTLVLTYGNLRAASVAAAQLLHDAASHAFPETSFEVTGQSGLRFLLDPDSETHRNARQRSSSEGGDSLAEIERAAVRESSTLTDPTSWLEEISWTDGAPVTEVEPVLAAAATYLTVADPDEGLTGRTSADGEARYHRAYWYRRTYSGPAFSLYALLSIPRTAAALRDLGLPVLPPLPAAANGSALGYGTAAVNNPRWYSDARDWLDGVELTWLAGDGRAALALRSLVHLLNDKVDGVPRAADVLAAAEDGTFTAVVTAIAAAVTDPHSDTSTHTATDTATHTATD